jgi:hypothetical protein
MQVKRVRDIETSKQLDVVFVSDVQRVAECLKLAGIDELKGYYGSLLVAKDDDGNTLSIYGLEGIVPWNDALVDKLWPDGYSQGGSNG